MERSQRMARINALLSRTQGVTMAQLMQELEASRATINRDLELMRSQMNTPILWDRETFSYRIDSSPALGTRYMLPGVWLTPEQAYAFLTLNNMVEQMAPSLLGPFLEPMRGMLKEMLGRADVPLYGLNHKIEIQSPQVPALSDQVFGAIVAGLLHEEGMELEFAAHPGDVPSTVQCLIQRIRILPTGWTLVLQTAPDQTVEVDAASVLRARVLNGGERG